MKLLYSLISIFLLSYYVNAKSLPIGTGAKDIQVDMKDPCSNEVLSVLRYFLPYPSDETKYIECNPWGFYTIRQCATGMKWNSWLMSCVRVTMEPPVENQNVGLIGVTAEGAESMNSTLCSYFGKDKCLNEGICNVYLDGSSRCLCTTNWTGVFCDVPSKVPIMGGVFGDMINETFSLDLYKQQRPLLNSSIEFNMTDPEILKDPETKVKVEKYMALYKTGKLQYHELVNYLVDDFLSLLYPSPFYLQEFNFPSELQTGLSGAIPNLLMTARYSYEKFDEFMRVYEDVLDNIVVYLESKDATIKTQAQLFYDVYVQIFKVMETKQPVTGVDGGVDKVEDLTREETVKRIGESFNMTLEKAYELFKVANKFDDDLALRSENFTTEQVQYAIGNFSISPEVVKLVGDIQEINADLYDSLSFYGFWYVLSSYIGPMESGVGPTTVAPIGSKVSVRSLNGEDDDEGSDSEDGMVTRDVGDDYFTGDDRDVRDLLLTTERVPKSLIEETTRVPKSLMEETTRIPKSLLEETTRIVKSLLEETTRIPKSLVEETTRIPKSLIEETTRIVKSLLEETTRIPKSLPEETTRIPKSLVEETTRIPKSLVEETTRVPKSLLEETTRIVKSLLEETTPRVPKSLVEETTRLPRSLVEETTRVPKSLLEETTRIVKSLLEETTRVPKSLSEETTRIVKSLLEESTRIPKSLPEVTTRIPKSLVEETTRIPKSLIEETTRIVKSLLEETTPRVPKSLVEESTTPRVPKSVEDDMVVMTTTIDPIQVQLNDLLKSPLNNI